MVKVIVSETLSSIVQGHVWKLSVCLDACSVHPPPPTQQHSPNKENTVELTPHWELAEAVAPSTSQTTGAWGGEGYKGGKHIVAWAGVGSVCVC